MIILNLHLDSVPKSGVFGERKAVGEGEVVRNSLSRKEAISTWIQTQRKICSAEMLTKSVRSECCTSAHTSDHTRTLLTSFRLLLGSFLKTHTLTSLLLLSLLQNKTLTKFTSKLKVPVEDAL
jgi:hypothetical protein